MTIGNVLLRPQVQDRSHTSGGYRMLDILLELTNRLLQDVLTEGGAAKKINDGLEAARQQLIQDVEQRLMQSADKITAWFQPYIDAITQGIPFSEEESSINDAIEGMKRLIELLIQTLDAMTAEQLGERLNTLLDVLEYDLGLSKDRVTSLFSDAIDEIIEALTSDYLQGAESRTAKNHFLIGRQISRLKMFVVKEMNGILPNLNRAIFIPIIVDDLKGRRWDELTGRIKIWLEKMLAAVDGFAQLSAPSVEVSVDVDVSTKNTTRGFGTRAPGEKVQMSWYASWFLQGHDIDFTEGDNVGNSIEGLIIEDYTRVKDRLKLDLEGFNIGFSEKLNASFMEHWAHISTLSGDAAEGILHLLSLEKGDYASNSLNAALQHLKSLFILLSHDHDGEDWPEVYKLISVLEYWTTAHLTVASSFEQFPGTGTAWFKAFLLPDMGEMLLYGIWTNHFRDFWLSLFTLINSRHGHPANSDNFQKAWGFSHLFMEIGLWTSVALTKAIWGEKHYGIPRGSDGAGKGQLSYAVLFGLLAGVIGSQTGWLWAFAISGKPSTDYWTKDSWLGIKTHFWSVIKWCVYWYLRWDGDTNDGTFGLDNASNPVPFPGYPNYKDSPYKLPYPKGIAYQCVQGNNGIWSHNAKTDRIYAYDFSHDEGDEVLAMRAGTVTEFNDEIPNNSTEKWNGLTILHDVPNEVPLPNPDHDRNQNGPRLTMADYGHGQHFGIQHAFALRGIPKYFIKGARIQQGHLVMFAGDTGRSQYNHLHVHLRAEENTESTIPFVFKEVENFIGLNGVAKSFTFYESDNEKKDIHLESTTKFQPDYHSGFARDHSPYSLQLNRHASKEDEYYNEAHIYLRITPKTDLVQHQYKKIIDYIGEEQKVFVEGGWDFEIPFGAKVWYRIGAKPYEEANEFNKKFCYLAFQDDLGEAISFEDGHEAYKYQKISRFPQKIIYGKVLSGGKFGTNSILLDDPNFEFEPSLIGRHIVIKRDGAIIQYKKINSYDPTLQELTIEGVWEMEIKGGEEADDYQIGAPSYKDAKKETGKDDKDWVYLAPFTKDKGIVANNFPDGREPYTYFIYQMNWK